MGVVCSKQVPTNQVVPYAHAVGQFTEMLIQQICVTAAGGLVGRN